MEITLTPTELSVVLSALWTIETDVEFKRKVAPRMYHQAALTRSAAKLQQAAREQLHD